MLKKEPFRIGLLILLFIAYLSGCKEKEPVGPDLTPPRVISVEPASEVTIEVIFSERVDMETAEDTSNYLIEGFSIDEAYLGSDKMTVILQTSLQDTSIYEITVSNVKDLAGNVMEEQKLTFSGWFFGILIRATLNRVNYYSFYDEAPFVRIQENRKEVTDAMVTIDGIRLSYYAGSYSADMSFESGKMYDLFVETPKGTIVTGSLRMTFPVEVKTPAWGDTFTIGQSIPVIWRYDEGVAPESVTVSVKDYYQYPYLLYSTTLKGSKLYHTIPRTIIKDTTSYLYIDIKARNYEYLEGVIKESYYSTSDIGRVFLYVVD